MSSSLDTRAGCNAPRFVPGDTRGHYESYFQRANHPTRGLGFWIRYTLTIPRGRPDAGVAELWAIYFDAERGRISASKQSHRLAEWSTSDAPFVLRIGEAELTDGSLRGAARDAAHDIAWSLDYASPDPPLLLLPARLYGGGFPKAKSLVGSPNAVYRGRLVVDGEAIDVDGWVGSQNHNWGQRHTDQYAWGQVAGFDDDAHSFLECVSARIGVGPWRSPALSMLVLRLDGLEYRLNTLWSALRAHAQIEGLSWHFSAANAGARVTGHIHADAEAFVALRYGNPPGGHKLCMNSKIAACDLVLETAAGARRTLRCRDRTAFELLGHEPPRDSRGPTTPGRPAP